MFQNVKKEIEDEIEDYIETLNKSDEPPIQEATKRSVTGKEVRNENEDADKNRASKSNKPQTSTPISSLGDLNVDLMDIKQSKIPVKIKFTKVEPSSSKETEGDGIKGRIRKVDDNVEKVTYSRCKTCLGQSLSTMWLGVPGLRQNCLSNVWVLCA